MDESFKFLVDFFLDSRRLFAALILTLACGLTIVWICIESLRISDNSDRWILASIVGGLLVVSAVMLFGSLRDPYHGPRRRDTDEGSTREEPANRWYRSAQPTG